MQRSNLKLERRRKVGAPQLDRSAVPSESLDAWVWAERISVIGLFTLAVGYTYLEQLRSVRFGGRWTNMSSITMLSAITRGRATPCRSPGIPAITGKGLCSAASDWVGCCDITIKRRREPAQSRLGLQP